jgi:hypothetical protein
VIGVFPNRYHFCSIKREKHINKEKERRKERKKESLVIASLGQLSGQLTHFCIAGRAVNQDP